MVLNATFNNIQSHHDSNF